MLFTTCGLSPLHPLECRWSIEMSLCSEMRWKTFCTPASLSSFSFDTVDLVLAKDLAGFGRISLLLSDMLDPAGLPSLSVLVEFEWESTSDTISVVLKFSVLLGGTLVAAGKLISAATVSTESTPVMKRFFKKVILLIPLFSRRKIRSLFNDAREVLRDFGSVLMEISLLFSRRKFNFVAILRCKVFAIFQIVVFDFVNGAAKFNFSLDFNEDSGVISLFKVLFSSFLLMTLLSFGISCLGSGEAGVGDLVSMSPTWIVASSRSSFFK